MKKIIIHHQKRKRKELKRDIIEIQSQEGSIEIGNIRKSLKKKKIMKIRNIRKILKPKSVFEKKNMRRTRSQEQGVEDDVNRNKIKFEPYGDLVDQGFSQFNKNSINNQEPHNQIENDETLGAEYPNENDSESTKINKISAIPNFMPQILPPDEITKSINSLNSMHTEVFDVVHTWAKNYVKYD